PNFVATANPFTVYLQLYHCLTALGDGRATQMLVEAHTLLQNRAQQFVNPEQKEMYLTVLAEHREIAALYEEVAKA
ncbi:MAG: hypothetical protein H6668_25335, partial [Ardenticatenaceae bacterium]|nr:hypothetical protein [Ardenticatenaceae bacterium]